MRGADEKTLQFLQFFIIDKANLRKYFVNLAIYSFGKFGNKFGGLCWLYSQFAKEIYHKFV